MKRFRRISAFFLTVVMILAMSCTVFAVEGEGEQQAEEAPKVDNVLEHEYVVYQILTGIVVPDENGAKILEGIKWGKDVEGKKFLEELQKSEKFAEGNPFQEIIADGSKKSADAVARMIGLWNSDTPEEQSANAREFARIAHKYVEGKAGTAVTKDTNNLPPGYYLVVDKEDLSNKVSAVRNLSFLQVVTNGSIVYKNKTDVPELKKEVREIDDSSLENIDDWDNVKLSEIEGKKRTIADYDIDDTVEFRLTATLPDDYDSYETYRYEIYDTMCVGLVLDPGSIKVYLGTEDQIGKPITEDFTISSITAEDEEDSFTITFADLKMVTRDGKSVIRVVYEAELAGENVVIGGEGNKNTAYLQYSNNPNNSGEGVGKTPEVTTVVFTYQLIVNKVNEKNEPLTGAEFQLFKYDADAESEDKYIAVEEAKAGTTADDGKIFYEFKGIDAGQYKLAETETPNGYNRADDLYFTVVAVRGEDKKSIKELRVDKVTDVNGNEFVNGEGTDSTPVFSFTSSLANGSLTTDIVNQSGLLLPATGGIGTTIFYVVGGILVVGAGVLLIAKKRSDKTKSE